MTSVTASSVLPSHSRRRARFADVVRMEWVKVRSIPSTFLALGMTLVLGIGLSALISGLVAREYARNTTPELRLNWDPTAISTAGVGLAQLALAVLAAMTITSEYSTGEIRGTLVAAPRRLRTLAAKATVVGSIGLVAAWVTMFAAFFIGQALISGRAPTASIDQPGVLRALLGGGLYVVVLEVLALSIGVLLRGTASTVTVLVAMIYVLPPILTLLPESWRTPILKYWPTEAGGQIIAVVRRPDVLAPWVGLGVMAGFAAVVAAVAAVRFARSDA